MALSNTRSTPSYRPLIVTGLNKSFTMHLRDSIELPVVRDVEFCLEAGKLSVLGGPSGAGKSSILKMIYGNYAVDSGSVVIAHRGNAVDLAKAEPRTVLDVRTHTLGYVSQFLRVVPRVSALDVVADPLVARGIQREQARIRAGEMLRRLNLPERLWHLPPATFSGGEQQRVNIARGFITDHPVLLLDEPTASLDAINAAAVAQLIAEKKADGVAMLGIFHDAETRKQVADFVIDVTRFAPERAAA